MRKLPVYLLIDTSGSMLGEPIEAVKNGIQVLLTTLRQDPYALETAHLSIISFNSTAQQLVPLTELSLFNIPEITASGSTALGEALALLSQKIEMEVQQSTSLKKGDWKPIVFIMTDGSPTDEWKNGLNQFKSKKLGLVVACAAGSGANVEVLKQITDIVVMLDTADSTTIKAFFKWVSASVSTRSQQIENGGQEFEVFNELPPPPPEIHLVV